MATVLVCVLAFPIFRGDEEVSRDANVTGNFSRDKVIAPRYRQADTGPNKDTGSPLVRATWEGGAGVVHELLKHGRPERWRR